MVNLFRSFFVISFFMMFAGLFMVTLVYVMSEPRPGFTRTPPPTAFITDPAFS